MDDTAYISVKSISLSTCGGKKPCTLLDAARHNLREIQAERGANSHIDAQRMADNLILAGPSSANAIKSHADSLLNAAGVAKLRVDHCQAIELVFSLPNRNDIDAVRYFERCLRWASSAMGLPALSAVIHRDEGARHCHVLMLPLKNGTHIGSKPIERKKLTKLRESFFEKVAGPAGLTRSMAKLHGRARDLVASVVVAHCYGTGLPDAAGVLWPFIEAKLRQDPLTPCRLLGIDPASIRPDPVEIGTKPYRDSEASGNDRTLSCVGFTNKPHSPPAPNAPLSPAQSISELWERVGCKKVLTIGAKQPGRRQVAFAAVSDALSRQAERTSRRPQALPLVRVRDDGLTVDRRDAEPCPW